MKYINIRYLIIIVISIVFSACSDYSMFDLSSGVEIKTIEDLKNIRKYNKGSELRYYKIMNDIDANYLNSKSAAQLAPPAVCGGSQVLSHPSAAGPAGSPPRNEPE